MDLFDQQTIPLFLARERSTELHFWPNWLELSRADLLLHTAINTIPWQADKLKIAGKEIPVPRLHCWYGEPASSYRWSGLTMQARPFPDWLNMLNNELEKQTSYRFNHCLANYYRDGKDSVDWHADDEPELGRKPVIASVSLGAERIFQMRHRITGERFDLALPHGSLLLMGQGMQNHWQHKIPKVKGLEQPRINFTFRFIAS